jgi:phage FluMu protein Com
MAEESGNSAPRQFLGVYFVKCNVYGRLYKNAEGTAYVGRCPKCGAPYSIRIGSEGTSSRFFNAFCPGR